ncbi:eCIS core domain-containing protein [Massilia scottii]|uniref:eCIS core domain-containing protein n=1 Tax=Massilia scottii TaxID=3057166 RepID=UPI002796A0F6|nr:DUF4157 domain-containing protein [Massilia sp. CCM 9029]MDQ1830670.1 DUF4157 domain-containing protein [Massilia sp. CCM 9029]
MKANASVHAPDTVRPDAVPAAHGAVAAFEDRRPAAAAQRQLMQMAGASARVQRQRDLAASAGSGGLPPALKSSVEAMSGISMDAARVHYNSARPAQLGALAYAQGSDIHLGPGQERHLPHEAWHLVQQAQGRVTATMQQKGVAINDDQGLEREADVMGARAQSTQLASERTGGVTLVHGGRVLQGLFDSVENAINNKRKAGVEITEANAAGNGILAVAPQGGWAGMTALAKAAAWTHTANLPDANGALTQWHMADAASAAMAGNFGGAGGKSVAMQWGSVQMTEDYGEFEWIIRHPSTVVGITHYRDELAAISAARGDVRAALAGVGAASIVIARNTDPAAGEAYLITPGATNAASSQITFESTDRAVTKRALMEGLSHGLDRRNIPNRASLADADADVANTVATAAARVAVAGVDMELIMAYLIGDVCHKMAVLIPGNGWGGAVAANFKQWRTLFPKSHPSQIMFQAMDAPPTQTNIGALNGAIAGQAAAIVDDIVDLFASKLWTMRMEWSPGHFDAASDPAGDLFGSLQGPGILPAGGMPALRVALDGFVTYHGVAPAAEFANALAAVVDYTGTAADVVKSTGFATHSGSNKGVAFEDRAEVATDFPGLATTYARIKEVLNRY